MFERLTADKVYLNSIRFGIQVNFPPHCGHEKAKEVDDFVKNVFDRLAVYEDSGLTPEQVQELAQAKAEGRLVVLPCKTEDTVFIVYAKKILETTVDKRAWTDDDGYMLRTKEEWFKEKDIGKTVFLTREEAEKALGGGGNDKG